MYEQIMRTLAQAKGHVKDDTLLKNYFWFSASFTKIVKYTVNFSEHQACINPFDLVTQIFILKMSHCHGYLLTSTPTKLQNQQPHSNTNVCVFHICLRAMTTPIKWLLLELPTYVILDIL